MQNAPLLDAQAKNAPLASTKRIASNDRPLKSPTASSLIGSILTKRWTAEVASCVFALAALAGLVVILRTHQDRPLPQWPQLVTINSIVSIFSLLMRAGVCYVLAEGLSQLKWQWFRQPHRLIDMERFDNASRGAWGSFLLMCRFGFKRVYLIAALGCFITIMASLTGFATQQLVVFQNCMQKDLAAVASIARTNNFTAAGTEVRGAYYDTFPPMVVAINLGIIQPVDDLTAVLSSCESGNCTFPIDIGASFSTVGVSHKCKNITSEVWETQVINGTGTMALLNLSSNALNPINISLKLEDDLTTLRTGVMGSTSPDLGAIATVKFLFRKSPTMSNYSAISCYIYPSVITYGARIHKSRLEESVINVKRIGDSPLPRVMPSIDTEYQVYYKLATTRVLQNGMFRTCDPKTVPGPGLLPVSEVNVDDEPGALFNSYAKPKIYYFPTACVWSFYKGPTQGIQNYLKEVFDGQKVTWGQNSLGNTGSVILRQFFQGGNMTHETVDDMFKNMTRSMTAVIRTHGAGGASENLLGDMWFSTTCAKINWHWIAFPAAMIGLTVIFLVLVIIESHGVSSDRLWKSSALASLFCEVDHTVVREERIDGKVQMSTVASSTSVCLAPNDQGLRLVGSGK